MITMSLIEPILCNQSRQKTKDNYCSNQLLIYNYYNSNEDVYFRQFSDIILGTVLNESYENQIESINQEIKLKKFNHYIIECNQLKLLYCKNILLRFIDRSPQYATIRITLEFKLIVQCTFYSCSFIIRCFYFIELFEKLSSIELYS